MKILIYGWNGMLGQAFLEINNKHIIEYGNDVSDKIYTYYEVDNCNPDLVLNFAGVIASDKLYKDILEVNLMGVLNLLQANIPVVSIGSIAALEPTKSIYALSKKYLDMLPIYYKNLHIIRIPGIFSSKRKEGAIYNFYKNANEHKIITINSDLQYWNCLELLSAVQTIHDNLDIILNNTFTNIGYKERHTLSTVADNFTNNYSIIREPKKFSMNKLKGKFLIPKNSLKEDLKEYVYLCNS